MTCCSWARGATSDERSKTQRRPPTDYDAEPHPAAHGPLRERRDAADPRLRAASSTTAGTRATWHYTEDGYHQGACPSDEGDVELVLTSDMNLGFEGPRAIARTLIKEGETRFCALSWRRRGAAHDR